ncbi:hypothetical protein G7043_33680 [Lentzea sp. NEAU-D13]|uniref:Uncharacterized protein n=1 Tax=Lentzea alba TaxID=2714351 RepID=A0A7C9RX37_9PSEU|nr:hypothetical protein [Lentzea alba]NGY63883.1 hypothetical protein [Lentzea alba]
MSAIFIIDHHEPPAGHEDETWNPSRGVFVWVVEVLADRVRDDELAGLLREFLKGGYAWLALTYYTPDQGAEIVRVVREELKDAIEAEQPAAVARNAAVHHMIDELVGMADRWAGSSGVTA